MAGSNSKARPSTKAKRGTKAQDQTARKVTAAEAKRRVDDAQYRLSALIDLAENLTRLPIQGYTAELCISSLVDSMISYVQGVEAAADAKVEKHVKRFVREAVATLGSIREAAAVFDDSDYDDGMDDNPELKAMGLGLEKLIETARAQLDHVGALLSDDYIAMTGSEREIRLRFGIAPPEATKVEREAIEWHYRKFGPSPAPTDEQRAS